MIQATSSDFYFCEGGLNKLRMSYRSLQSLTERLLAVPH